MGRVSLFVDIRGRTRTTDHRSRPPRSLPLRRGETRATPPYSVVHVSQSNRSVGNGVDIAERRHILRHTVLPPDVFPSRPRCIGHPVRCPPPSSGDGPDGLLIRVRNAAIENGRLLVEPYDRVCYLDRRSGLAEHDRREHKSGKAHRLPDTRWDRRWPDVSDESCCDPGVCRSERHGDGDWDSKLRPYARRDASIDHLLVDRQQHRSKLSRSQSVLFPCRHNPQRPDASGGSGSDRRTTSPHHSGLWCVA